ADFHSITRLVDSASTSTVTQESIQTNKILYVREGADPWSVQPEQGNTKCKLGPMAGSDPLLAVLSRLKGTSVPREGPNAISKAGACRLWTLNAAEDPLRTLASVCADTASHLTYEFHSGGIHVQYSSWNAPIVITPPPDSEPVLPGSR